MSRKNMRSTVSYFNTVQRHAVNIRIEHPDPSFLFLIIRHFNIKVHLNMLCMEVSMLLSSSFKIISQYARSFLADTTHAIQHTFVLPYHTSHPELYLNLT